MNKYWQAFLIALQFLTAVPLPVKPDYSRDHWNLSVYFYPLAGLIIGLILYFFVLLLDFLPAMLLASLCLAVWFFVTGGLHHDGLADMVDAWYGGHKDSSASLEIMKDPRSGPMAVMALIITALIQFSALNVIINEHISLLWLVLVAFGSRLSLLPLMASCEYIRQDGLGQSISESLSLKTAMTGFVLGCMAIILLMGMRGIYFSLVMMTMLFVYRHMVLRQFAGITGDIAGAFIPLSEALLLVVVCAF